MAYFVSWTGADKVHTISTGKSGGTVFFDRSTRHASAKKLLVTRCGRDVPEDHIASTELTDGQALIRCLACQNTLG